MVIAIFGENCVGKSTVAKTLQDRTNAEVFSGKDYLRLAKNEAEAEKLFTELLLQYVQKSGYLIYSISEKEQLRWTPEGAIRVLVTAELGVIKERFSKRMHGVLPAPVAAMLERKHGSFDEERCDVHVVDGEAPLDRVCEKILTCRA